MRTIPTSQDILHSGAEICVNLWCFVDDTGIVLRIAAKAYALTGTDEQKLIALHLMAGTDHLTATQGKVPSKFVVDTENGEFRGAVPLSVCYTAQGGVFGPLMDQIEKELPECIRSVADNYQRFKMTMPEDPLCVTTAVYERADGELVARVGKP